MLNVVASVLRCDLLIDELMLDMTKVRNHNSSNCDHGLCDANEATADELQALPWLTIARVKGNNVATDNC